MQVEILVVGDEIVSGVRSDTNSNHVARRLFDCGLQVTRVTQVRDRGDEIRAAARAALERTAVLVVTGGLGPTPDDLTKEALAELFDDALEFDADTLEEMRQRWSRRGMQMPDVNRKQAYLPRSAHKIANPVGSAPGVHWERDDAHVFLLPGVPAEMRAMLEQSVIPSLSRFMPETPARVAEFRTVGKSESALAQRLLPVLEQHDDVAWAFYPSARGVDVRLRDESGTSRQFEAAVANVRGAVGPYIYTEQPGVSLAEVVQSLVVERGLRLAVAESCTGGLLGASITDVPGSSASFVGGFVTYDNAAKRDWLGVPQELLEAHGAVSAPVAAAMARGARARAGVDLGLAITGVAGPTGGTAEKPVGLVFLALATTDACWTRRLQLTPHRDTNRTISSHLALDMLRRHLLELPVGERA
jgi:nicotinamide-nucleotide amidase